MNQLIKQKFKLLWKNKKQFLKFIFLALPLLIIYYICYPIVELQYHVSGIYNKIDEEIYSEIVANETRKYLNERDNR